MVEVTNFTNIMHALFFLTADPRPRKPTVTVNIGETAHLSVIRNNLMGIRWKRTEYSRNLPEGKNNDNLMIADVTSYNGTVYEALEVGQRMEPHSMIRLIVRGKCLLLIF